MSEEIVQGYSQQAEEEARALPLIKNITQDEFLEAANRKEVLTQEEEREVFLYYQEHPTIENRNLIALKNDNLVWKYAKQYATSGIPVEDLHAEGFIGLLTAVERFDLGKGAKFSTYATLWIEQAILRYLKYNGRTIRLPINMVVTYAKIKRFEKSYHAEVGCQPSVEEIADGIGESQKEVKRVLEAASFTYTSSLNAPIASQDGSDEAELQDFIPDTRKSLEDEATSEIDRKDIVEYVKSVLTEREWYVLSRRFGFTGERQTLEALGKELGVTREWIRQTEARALRKLQAPKVKRFFMAYRK